jgi:hypothetical protein
MGNTFRVLGGKGFGGMDTADAFLRIFGPDGFFMGGVLITHGGGVMPGGLYRVRIFSAPARSMAIRL